MHSVDLIQHILTEKSNIAKISVIQFPDSELLQERFSLKRPQIKALNYALKIRKKYNLPFWDALLLTQLNHKYYSEKFIKGAGRHNSITKKKFIDRDKWPSMSKVFLEKAQNIGLNSSIIDNNGKQVHIPLLDFHIPNSKSNIKCVEQVIKEIKLKGYLLKTNKSFHFYGSELLTQKQYLALLSQVLLYSPIIDKNWVAHQLIEGSATLRITSKEGLLPRLIKQIV